MADIKSKEARSYNMAQIKNKDTKPEEKVRKALYAEGFRYRKNDKRLLGTPDIYLPKYKTVIFVNGCFWHGHEGCKYFVMPKSNVEFWTGKINGNIERDKRNEEELKRSGYNVITVWECQLKKAFFQETIEKITECILKG